MTWRLLHFSAFSILLFAPCVLLSAAHVCVNDVPDITGTFSLSVPTVSEGGL